MKKADVSERLEAFVHVGLLVNEPPDHRRVALYLVLRQFRGGAPLTFTTARPTVHSTARGGESKCIRGVSHLA